MAAPNMEVFDSYFRRADLDKDGRISGAEAVAFFQGSNLPKHVLAQIWMYADQNRTGFLGRPEFYNALKLVTVAQSGRELTQDIVKAALFGPAAAKIPAPQINPVPAPAAQMNSVTMSPHVSSMVPPSTQMGAATATSQNFGFRGPQTLPNMGMNQNLPPTSGNNFMRPTQTTVAASSPAVQGVNQGLSVGGNTGPHLPGLSTPNLSTDWLGSSTSGASTGETSQVSTRGITPIVNQGGLGLALPGVTPGLPPRPQAPSPPATSVPSKPMGPVLPSSSQTTSRDSKALAASGNGFSSDSVFGGDVFSAASQAKPGSSISTLSTGTMPNVSTTASVTSGSQNLIKPGQVDPTQRNLTHPLGGSQLQQTQTLLKQNQLDTLQNMSTFAVNTLVRPANSVASQSEVQWPRFTQSNIQKYTAVFVEVDKDRDGKITGEQARNLFLSWKLPREVLKQVWDLSDQDNDSMLSLREFCTALYLMERFREGRPLPAVLPNSVKFDEALLQATGQPPNAYGSPAWQTIPGWSQQGIPGNRPGLLVSGTRPPIQNSVAPQIDGAGDLLQQKLRVPLFEDLTNQHSKMEQDVPNSNSLGATEEGNKVQESEKILDSKEKIEFYRTKMQELVLYKSRCDNRLNEITERASADKREAESLGKKYEEKYKQVADIASKLTVEEATFRHIQERKLELQNAIIKMEQGGSVDGLLQVRADRIQSDLEDLVKALNDRCKQHGIHVNSTASVELPYGWQPGIQEGAVDWDEEWDKFEDEGFSIAKELSIEVENGIPEKSKSPSAWSEKTSADEVSSVVSSSHFHGKVEKSYTSDHITESGSAYDQSENGSARSPPGSPGRSAFESPSREFHSQFEMQNISPSARDTHSDHGGAESTISGDKYGDESSWGATFDTTDDVDSVWGFGVKDTGHERSNDNSFFGSGGFGLDPIKVDSPSAGSVFGKEKSTLFADSVPSTPLFNSNSPSKFNDGLRDHSFDSSSRFDSFSMHDSSGFFPQRETLTRFDSIRSTSDFGHSQGFSSFDDSDPFGSTGPFKSSESHSPRRGSDNWSAF